MATAKAPYNFIPVSEKVVLPKWGNLVNHDIPFADGNSGTIQLKLTAESPIIVKENNESSRSFKLGDNYMLPGSSLKGMFRNVLETMSYSKLSYHNMNDNTYALRDLNDKENYKILELSRQVEGGWLRKEGDSYFLKSCGKPGRIPHPWIDSFYKTNLTTFYNQTGAERFSGNKNEHKSAKFKYDKFNNLDLRNTFETAEYGSENKVDIRKYFKINPQSRTVGNIVFTGQAGQRKAKSGKIHEFIFFESENKEVEVPEEVMKNFFFAYYDHDKNQQSIDFKYWNEKLAQNEQIPVFFRYKDTKNRELLDMGLSFLYKIKYKNSTVDLIPNTHKTDKLDLAEVIFGHTKDLGALKGRVHVGHALIENYLGEEKEVATILGSPKASYAPNYIRQIGSNGKTNNYRTYMDDTALIAGWKRYPVHLGIKIKNAALENSKVASKLKPLKKGTSFTCNIRVHNLRNIELGALLSAITFHKGKDMYHSLGLAKPLGYGKLKVEISNLIGFSKPEIDFYLKQYECYMNNELGYSKPDWHQNSEMIEMSAMVSDSEVADKQLEYMTMDVKGTNEFIEAKKSKSYLQNYSDLSNTKTGLNSNISALDLIDFKKVESENTKHFENSIFNLNKAKTNHLTLEEERFVSSFNEKKSKLAANLSVLSEKLKQQITTLNKDLRRINIGDTLVLDHIDVTNRKAFENVKKAIEKFVKDSEGKNYNQIKKEKPNGVLNVDNCQIVQCKVKEIFTSLKLKDQQKKEKIYTNKLIEWCGKDATIGWNK